MKNKILNIINNIENKRMRVATIKNDDVLWNWVIAKSEYINNISDSERLYLALYGKSKKCSIDETNIKYVSFSVGYKFCGPANRCDCARTSVTKKVKGVKAKYTTTKRKEILAKRIVTINDRYGVDNVFKWKKDNNECIF